LFALRASDVLGNYPLVSAVLTDLDLTCK
jgi:hypothetical protein